MYTYKLGGMLITDELYHDDLEAVTFGRKDQNELMHYGIKGQSWGKRRFQNEDGSLTMAGRNRYDVGAPLTGTTAANMSKNLTYKTWNGSSNGYGGAGGGKSIPIHKQTFAKSNQLINAGSKIGNAAKNVSGYNVKTNTYTTPSVRSSVVGSADAGKKAADNIFGRIGNWASNAAKDVGNAATNVYGGAKNLAVQAGNAVDNAANDAKNWVGDRAQDVGRVATSAYNDASKAIGNVAQDVGNFVKNAPQNISDLYTGDKAGREAQRHDNVVQNFERNGDKNINEGVNKISDSIDKDIDRIDIDLHGNKGDSSAYYAKNRDDLHDMSNKQFLEGLNQRDMGYRQNDIAREYGQKADEAQARYDAAPRQLLNAAGNWIGDRVSDAGNTVGNVLKPGINAVGNAVRDVGNWVGDRAQDVGNAASDAYDSVKDTVSDAVQGVKNWYTGEGDKRSADWYRNLSTRDTDFLGTGQNLIEGHQAVADESREIADNLRKNGDYENAKRYEQNAEAYQRAVDQMTSDRNRNLSNADMYDERYNNAPRQVLSNLPGNISNAANDVGSTLGNAANSAGNAIGNAARDVGDWASNAASDVRDWGAGAVESGKNFFNNLFGGGNKEPEQPTLSDPNDRMITENIIPEQRITEQRIPEQRITEQRIPEAIIREGEKYRQMTPDQRQAHMDSQKNRPTVSGSNNVQTWDNGNINTWDNVKTFGDPDMVNTIKMLNDNGFFNRGSSSNSENSSSMSDKPSNVSDEFWREYTFNGGTREQYDAEMQRMRNQNANRQQSSNVMTDKPSNVSDEFWREYTFNGGTRDSYDREMNARKNSKNNQNDSASRKEVVGTVDTSRPHHFTYDPASGQTIVVYDDEKRR